MRGLSGALKRLFSPRPDLLVPPREDVVLAHYDRQFPKETRSMKKIVRRVAFGTAAVAGLGILACGAPAEVDVQGTWLSVTLPAGTEAPDREALARVLDARNAADVAVRMQRTPDGTTLEISVWGGEPPQESLREALVRELPMLADATFREAPIDTTVRVSLAEKIGHEWLETDLAAGSVEEAKQRIIDEIRAREGTDARIDVQIEEGPNGRREVNVKVRKERDDEAP